MYARVLKCVSRVLVLGVAASIPMALSGQVGPEAKAAPVTNPSSRWDIFLGYSYLSPHGTVDTPLPNGVVIPASYNAVDVGGIGSVAYYFNRYLGLQGEFAVHEWGVQNSNSVPTNGTEGNDDGFSTFTGGVILRYPRGNITPFVHALAGGALIDGPTHNPFTWGPDFTGGGGLDYETHYFNHHLAIRIIQADYEYMHANFGDGTWGGVASVNAIRLSAGLVFHGGSILPPPPVTLACTINPVSVFPGDPVTVTTTAGDLNPKLNAIYSWSGAGATGNGTTVTIDTGSLAPGPYTVKAEVREGKPGKEGLKPGETADCSSNFTVKAFEPPTVTCSASPSPINPGDKSTITSTGVSPQNRPLTYSFSVAPGTGTITGNGSTATYDSTGAPTGAVAVTCNVSDDKGNTASSGTSVVITAPIPPQLPHATALCPISFANDKRRPTRVDNEAKACLDQVTDALKNDSTATVVVVGEADAKEKTPPKSKHAKVQDFAAERAENTKDYLVNEEQSGIDASRVIVRTGTSDSQTVEDYLVPAGATFDSDVPGTSPVDESTVKTVKRKPIGQAEPKKHHKKAAEAAQ
jgi:hypothetical protein